MPLPELSVEAITANQKGQMTSQQRAKLREQQLLALGVLVLMSSASLAFITTGVNDLVHNDVNSSTVLLVVLPSILMAVFVVAFVLEWPKIANDLKTGAVESITGKIQLGIGGGRSASYKVTIRSMDFTISKELYKALSRGETYQIYYAPSSKTLLSIRRI